MNRRNSVPAMIIGGLAVLAIAFVGASLQRQRPPIYVPSPILPREVGRLRAGPFRYTIDATHERQWRFFDFSRSSWVGPSSALDWDLAFRRNRIIANGGRGFAGRAGIVDLGEVAFESIDRAPAGGYRPTETRGDTVNPAIANWYDYAILTHVLTPKPRVYAIRTADGRYAKMEILSYYCPGARAGCLTFRYVYQGDGSRALEGRPNVLEPIAVE